MSISHHFREVSNKAACVYGEKHYSSTHLWWLLRGTVWDAELDMLSKVGQAQEGMDSAWMKKYYSKQSPAGLAKINKPYLVLEWSFISMLLVCARNRKWQAPRCALGCTSLGNQWLHSYEHESFSPSFLQGSLLCYHPQNHLWYVKHVSRSPGSKASLS